jgi:DNA-binding transcriptional ArsR family regulator
MKQDVPEQEVFEAISSEKAREILAMASREPNSAKDLEEESDATLTTIYHHTGRLTEANLLRTETQIDPEGDHYETFETTVSRVSLEIENGEWSLDIRIRDDLADRFSTLWRMLGE